MGLPCRHILRLLKMDDDNLFVPGLCKERWLKSYLPIDLINDTNEMGAPCKKRQPEREFRTEEQKFVYARDLFQRINEQLSTKPTNLFRTYIDQLRTIEQLIDRDQLFAVQPLVRILC